MQNTGDKNHNEKNKGISRRELFKATVAVSTTTNITSAFSQERIMMKPEESSFYVGTYTGSPGEGANGEGIYFCQMSLTTGKVTNSRLVASVSPNSAIAECKANPSTLDIDPTGNYLYVGNEIFSSRGAVSAYRINRQNGNLTYLNSIAAMGAPTFVKVDKFRRYLFSAEYVGSYFEAFPIQADGSLGQAVFKMKTEGFVGPKKATNGPAGNFAVSAHEGPDGHPHQMQADPSNQWVLGADAGQDRIYIWQLDQNAQNPLTPARTPFVQTPPGDGPRHFAFHPNGIWMYSIQEEASTIIFWMFNQRNGSLVPIQQVSSLPKDFQGTSFASEIRVSSNGRFVYAANRLSDSICVFRIGSDGQLTQISYVSTLGDYPRIITIDPSGEFLVSANQRADNITTFRISQTEPTHRYSEQLLDDGKLTFTGNYTSIGSPSGIVFW